MHAQKTTEAVTGSAALGSFRNFRRRPHERVPTNSM